MTRRPQSTMHRPRARPSSDDELHYSQNRPVAHHSTTYGRYTNMGGLHAQDGGRIYAYGPGHGHSGLRRSPSPVESDDESHPLPPELIPRRRPGEQHPRRNGPELVVPTPSSNHPVRPNNVDNLNTHSDPGPQPSGKILAGTSVPNPLHNNADKDRFSVCRDGKTEALYRIIQTEIRYGIDEGREVVPYSILGFRIERGGDRKRCLEVILKGEFTQSDEFKNVGVKQLHHVPSNANQLAELQIQKSSAGQSQFQVGFNGKPVALVTISGLKSTQFTVTKRQRIDSRFNDSQGESTFGLTLGLDDGLERDSDVSVAETVFFVIVVRLQEERQLMELSLSMDVKYRSGSKWPPFGSKTKVVSKSYTHVYSGRRSLDIIKNRLEQ